MQHIVTVMQIAPLHLAEKQQKDSATDNLLPTSLGHPDWLPLSKLAYSPHQKGFPFLADGRSCWGSQHWGTSPAMGRFEI